MNTLAWGAKPPSGFPRMPYRPVSVDSLAWYHSGTPGLEAMHYDARDEVVSLIYPGQEEGMVGVPRTLAPDAPLQQDHRTVGEFTFTANFKSSLRPEQEPFVADCFRMLETEYGGIGEAPTGFGKTVCGAALICAIGRPTCIIVPKGDLDWKPELLAHTDIPESRIDKWQGQSLPSPDAWVVVASLQSIYREGIYPEEVYRRFACVMFDEVHRLGAPEFSAAMRKFPAMLRLGFSATAERRDGKMDLIHSHLGWRHVVGHTDAEQPDYFIIPSPWSEPFIKGNRVAYDPARTNLAKKSLMADTLRNSAICAAAYRAHKAGRRIIMFVEQIAHGERLKTSLLSMGVPESRIIEYNGSISAEDKRRAKTCPEGIILIATYKYTAEGTNIPLLDTAIIAHPIYDPRQAVGRVLRKVEGKPKPVVLDVWDTQSGTLSRIAKARWSYLLKQGATWKGTFS